ncbi:hypothetical protein CPAR01_10688 [Colletotrichum paranaense]|uniref:Uncharacterized protein n=1 Tax=Colletotrichum paranaense TaxID=1914294 RepID=A0ABQ9SER2_9PEZI|nr:uncharacterized protein CPAR01_10688 [Colletotrichum paranaense]KAK1533980.1 hypothetical protein CPAR01_10688 [Colletotrichum paranaense]
MIILFLTGLFFAWFACAAQVPRLVTVNINKANMTMTATAIQSGAILGRQLRDPNICGYVANKPLACPNNGSCRTDKDGFIGCCDEKGQSCSIYTICFPGPQKPTPANSGTLICTGTDSFCATLTWPGGKQTAFSCATSPTTAQLDPTRTSTRTQGTSRTTSSLLPSTEASFTASFTSSAVSHTSRPTGAPSTLSSLITTIFPPTKTSGTSPDSPPTTDFTTETSPPSYSPPPEATPSTSDKPPAPPPGSGIMQDLTNEQRMLYLWTVEREKYTKSANDGV